MFDSLKQWFTKDDKKTSRPRTILGQILPIGPANAIWTTPTSTYAGYAKEGYQDNSDVYACINIIARCCKGVNWKVLKKASAGKVIDEVEDGEKGLGGDLWRLIQRPNFLESWKKFVENWVGYYCLAGNEYIVRNGPSDKKPPSELWHLRPDRMEIIPGDKINPIAGYKLTLDSGVSEFKPDRMIDGEPWQRVLHMKRFNPLDDYYGLSPIQPAAKSVDQNNAAATVNYAILKNGMRTSGAFILEGNYDEEMINQLRNTGETQFAGPENAGRFLIVGGGIKDWKDFGIKPKDMEWAAGQALGTRKICSIFGVPVDMVGETTNSTYAHFKEVRKALYMETVMPLLDEMVDELNRWLVPLFDDSLTLDYDRDDIEAVKDERHVVWQRVDQAVRSGWVTPNEARKMVGIETFVDPTGQADQLRLPTRDTVIGTPDPISEDTIEDTTEGPSS